MRFVITNHLDWSLKTKVSWIAKYVDGFELERRDFDPEGRLVWGPDSRLASGLRVVQPVFMREGGELMVVWILGCTVRDTRLTSIIHYVLYHSALTHTDDSDFKWACTLRSMFIHMHMLRFSCAFSTYTAWTYMHLTVSSTQVCVHTGYTRWQTKSVKQKQVPVLKRQRFAIFKPLTRLTSILVPSEECVWSPARSTLMRDSIWPCRRPLWSDSSWLSGCWDPPRCPNRLPCNPARTTWSSGSEPGQTGPARRTVWVRTRGSPAWYSNRRRATNQCQRPKRRPAARGWSTGSPTRGAPLEVAAWRLSPSPGGNADRRSDSPSSTTRCCSSGICGRSCPARGRRRSRPTSRPGCAAGRNR